MPPDLDALCREHEAALRRVCRRIVGESDADDIVQETLIRALTHPARVPTGLRPWLVTVARNLSLNHVRRARRVELREAPEDDVVSEPESGPEEAASRREDSLAAVLVALEALPATERHIVFLRDVVELSPPDTAAALGLTPGTVRVLHHRARRTLDKVRPEPGATPVAGARSSIAALEQLVTWLLTQVVAEGGTGPHDQLVGMLTGHLAIVEAVVGLAAQCGDRGVHARALLCRGNIFRVMGRFGDAEGDIRAAIAVADAGGDGPLARLARVRLAAMLGYAEGSDPAFAELDRVLVGALGPAEEAMARNVRLTLLVSAGRWDEVPAEIEALERLGTEADSRARMLALHQVGCVHLVRYRYAQAAAVYGECLGIAERRGEIRAMASAGCNLGLALYALADHAGAMATMQSALEKARGCADVRLEGQLLANIAQVLQDEGKLSEAIAAYEQAQAVNARVGNKRGHAITAFNAAVCEQARGRAEAALRTMREARAALEDVGHDLMSPYVSVFLPACELELGLPGAEEALAEARETHLAGGRPQYVAAADTLSGLADVRRGDLDAARRKVAAAETLWTECRTAALLVSAAIQRAS